MLIITNGYISGTTCWPGLRGRPGDAPASHPLSPKKEFAALKLKLLRWVRHRLSQDRNAKVITRLAIPYNPSEPEPYDRWTLKGLFDLNRGEILVGEEFWNFVSCDNIYEELLDVFKAVGDEIRNEIDEKFKQIR
jgi:hypothetical protein